jgi:hypothetical protein
VPNEYVVRVSGPDESEDDFSERITSMLREGWTPLGGLAVYTLGGRDSVRFAQALVRDEESIATARGTELARQHLEAMRQVQEEEKRKR